MLSDNDQQPVVDLFEGSEADTSAETGTTDENPDLLLDGEESQAESPEEEKPAVSTAQVQRQKNVDHWVNEINSGRKKLSDLPADKQFMKADIQKGIKATSISDDDLDRRFEDKFKKKEEEFAFKALQTNLNQVKLTQAQKSTLQEEFKENRELGLSYLKALEKAAKATGISLDPEDHQRMILRQRMALPPQGQNAGYDRDVNVDDPEFHKKVQDPKRKMELLMKAMRAPN